MNTPFDAFAPTYDEDTFHPYVAEQLVAELPRRPRLLVDVACGTGAAAFAALRLEPTAVFAVDLSVPMVELARGKAVELDPEGHITWHVGPANPLPIGDGEADALVCASALHFLGQSALADWHRVLRPGGRLAFSMVQATRFKRGDDFPFPADLRVPATLEDAAALATDAGFHSATARHLTLDQGDRVRQVFAVFATA